MRRVPREVCSRVCCDVTTCLLLTFLTRFGLCVMVQHCLQRLH